MYFFHGSLYKTPHKSTEVRVVYTVVVWPKKFKRQLFAYMYFPFWEWHMSYFRNARSQCFYMAKLKTVFQLCACVGCVKKSVTFLHYKLFIVVTPLLLMEKKQASWYRRRVETQLRAKNVEQSCQIQLRACLHSMTQLTRYPTCFYLYYVTQLHTTVLMTLILYVY